MLFLLPIHLAYLHRDGWMMNAYLLLMMCSLINHSHTHHPDPFRRFWFQWVARTVVVGLVLLAWWNTPTWQSFIEVSAWLGVNVFLYFVVLQGQSIETYTAFQKNAHVVFHMVGVISILVVSHKFYYKQLNLS